MRRSVLPGCLSERCGCAVVSADGNETMVDMEQQIRPFFWPAFLPPFKIWMHMILYLRDAPNG